MADTCQKQHSGHITNAVGGLKDSQRYVNGRHACPACAFEAGAEAMAQLVRERVGKFVEEKYGSGVEGDVIFHGLMKEVEQLLVNIQHVPVKVKVPA